MASKQVQLSLHRKGDTLKILLQYSREPKKPQASEVLNDLHCGYEHCHVENSKASNRWVKLFPYLGQVEDGRHHMLEWRTQQNQAGTNLEASTLPG
ncbi:hypothetical protein STEG23_013326 [Scotinomys teguina]